jgi:hypothetical protein
VVAVPLWGASVVFSCLVLMAFTHQ